MISSPAPPVSALQVSLPPSACQLTDTQTDKQRSVEMKVVVGGKPPSKITRSPILQLWFFRAGSHLIRVGGGLLVIALVITSILAVASLLAVIGLVTSLGAGIGVLLSIAALVVGIWGGLLLL